MEQGSVRLLSAQYPPWITKTSVLSSFYQSVLYKFVFLWVRRAFETTLFQEIYEQIDKNNDGTIVFEEFVTVLDHPKVNLSR